MHLKRYSMPESWPLPKKAKVYVATPMPGPHAKMASIPLKIIVRDVLKLAETAEEAKKILNSGKVLVDKKARKEPNFPVGLMDVFEIPEIHLRYRVSPGRKGLGLEKIREDETKAKLCRIEGKTTLRKGITQLNLHDGRCIIAKTGSYRVGDSIIIEIPEQKILRHFSLKKGEPCFIIAGRNTGIMGRIKAIKERKGMLEKSTIAIETEKGKAIETLKEYVMVGTLESEEEKGPKKEKA